MNTKNRVGRFIVDRSVIEKAMEGQDESRAAWNSIFGQLIVIETTCRWPHGTIEYLAHCDQFEDLGDAAWVPPVYDCTTTRHEEMMGAQKVTTYLTRFTRSK